MKTPNNLIKLFAAGTMAVSLAGCNNLDDSSESNENKNNYLYSSPIIEYNCQQEINDNDEGNCQILASDEDADISKYELSGTITQWLNIDNNGKLSWLKPKLNEDTFYGGVVRVIDSKDNYDSSNLETIVKSIDVVIPEEELKITSPDNKDVLCNSRDSYFAESNKEGTIWDASSDGVISQIGINQDTREISFYSSCYEDASSDLNIKASNGDEEKIKIVKINAFYNLPENAWDIDYFVFEGDSIKTQDPKPYDLFFSPDGNNLFELGNQTKKIYEYLCEESWKLSTCSYNGKNIISQNNLPYAIHFSPDGNNLFELGRMNDKIYKSICSIPWDLESCVLQSTINSRRNDTDFFFKNDGTKMYEIGINVDDGTIHQDRIVESTLSTPWDLSTAVEDVIIEGQDTHPYDMFFSRDGSKLFELGYIAKKLFSYNCQNEWDLSSCIYEKYIDIPDVSLGLFFKPDGTKMYLIDSKVDEILEYNLQ